MLGATTAPFTGMLDEVRISRRDREVEWVNAQHLSMVGKLISFATPGYHLLFLLDIGLVCGDRLSSLRRHGVRLVVFAIATPLFAAVIGMALGKLQTAISWMQMPSTAQARSAR